MTGLLLHPFVVFVYSCHLYCSIFTFPYSFNRFPDPTQSSDVFYTFGLFSVVLFLLFCSPNVLLPMSCFLFFFSFFFTNTWTGTKSIMFANHLLNRPLLPIIDLIAFLVSLLKSSSDVCSKIGFC